MLCFCFAPFRRTNSHSSSHTRSLAGGEEPSLPSATQKSLTCVTSTAFSGLLSFISKRSSKSALDNSPHVASAPSSRSRLHSLRDGHAERYLRSSTGKADIVHLTLAKYLEAFTGRNKSASSMLGPQDELGRRSSTDPAAAAQFSVNSQATSKSLDSAGIQLDGVSLHGSAGDMRKVLARDDSERSQRSLDGGMRRPAHGNRSPSARLGAQDGPQATASFRTSGSHRLSRSVEAEPVLAASPPGPASPGSPSALASPSSSWRKMMGRSGSGHGASGLGISGRMSAFRSSSDRHSSPQVMKPPPGAVQTGASSAPPANLYGISPPAATLSHSTSNRLLAGPNGSPIASQLLAETSSTSIDMPTLAPRRNNHIIFSRNDIEVTGLPLEHMPGGRQPRKSLAGNPAANRSYSSNMDKLPSLSKSASYLSMAMAAVPNNEAAEAVPASIPLQTRGRTSYPGEMQSEIQPCESLCEDTQYHYIDTMQSTEQVGSSLLRHGQHGSQDFGENLDLVSTTRSSLNRHPLMTVIPSGSFAQLATEATCVSSALARLTEACHSRADSVHRSASLFGPGEHLLPVFASMQSNVQPSSHAERQQQLQSRLYAHADTNHSDFDSNEDLLEELHSDDEPIEFKYGGFSMGEEMSYERKPVQQSPGRGSRMSSLPGR